MDARLQLPDIPEEEKTPLVLLLLELIGKQNQIIQELKDEVARLKGLPARPKLRPSGTSKLDKAANKARSGNSKKKKKSKPPVEIHTTTEIHPDVIPEKSVLVFYKDFIVQDITIKTNNTKYRRGVWKTPAGNLIWGKLPDHIDGHYGNELKSYILYLHHTMHVPQNKIHAAVCEIGVQISAGEIDRILSIGKDIFHAEKEEILDAGLKLSSFIVADDTGHRHKGNNGYGTHIGNDLFAYFQSSDRKNRLNFLEILSGPNRRYCVTGFAIDYFAKQKLPDLEFQILKRVRGQEFKAGPEWQEFLKRLGIRKEAHIKTVTEGALIGYILKYRIKPNLTVLSDDAGQFNILFHALCWVHSERVITALHPASDKQADLVTETLNDFWDFFKQLHDYKKMPSDEFRRNLGIKFDEIFSRDTDYPSLNKACESLKNKKEELLVVLSKPEIPLSNNISERDIRDLATKRKISAGTRSDTGRKSRDTFMSLKKTCFKLGISFKAYVYDRLSGEKRIPRLAELMKRKADLTYEPTPTF